MPLHAPFDVALRGFERHQVLEHIESLQGHITMAERDRDAAFARVAEMQKHLEQLRSEGTVLAHLHRQVDAATEQLHRLQQSPITGVTTRIQHMLTLAEDEAAEMRSQADADVKQVYTRAEAEAEQLRTRAEAETTSLRRRSQAESERLSQDTAQQCERLEAASQRRCRDAEQRCEQEIARRHAEATAQIAAQEKRSLARMHLMMRAVGEQVQAAQHEIASLRTLRTELAAQLSAADQSLSAALSHIHDTAGSTPRDESEPVPSQRQGAHNDVQVVSSPSIGSLSASVAAASTPAGA